MNAPHFDGETYEPERDHARLTGQMARVFEVMKDGRWRTLRDVSIITGDPEASVSARLRDTRKKRFGSWRLERSYSMYGLWEYRLLPPLPEKQLELGLEGGGR